MAKTPFSLAVQKGRNAPLLTGWSNNAINCSYIITVTKKFWLNTIIMFILNYLSSLRKRSYFHRLWRSTFHQNGFAFNDCSKMLKKSPVWKHFEIAENLKVQCQLCQVKQVYDHTATNLASYLKSASFSENSLLG